MSSIVAFGCPVYGSASRSNCFSVTRLPELYLAQTLELGLAAPVHAEADRLEHSLSERSRRSSTRRSTRRTFLTAIRSRNAAVESSDRRKAAQPGSSPGERATVQKVPTSTPTGLRSNRASRTSFRVARQLGRANRSLRPSRFGKRPNETCDLTGSLGRPERGHVFQSEVDGHADAVAWPVLIAEWLARTKPSFE